jgi:hypothetical protein
VRRAGFAARAPSIAPEKHLRPTLLHAFHTIRPERQLTERLEFDGGRHKGRYRGRDRVGWSFTLSAAAFTLIRLSNLPGERRDGDLEENRTSIT